MDPRDPIRRAVRARRRALSPRERVRLDEALANRLAVEPVFRRSRHIAFYFPNDGEVDLGPLVTRARDMGKRCYLPVLSPTFHNRLWFAPYRADSRLALNMFRIPEPETALHELRPVWTLDLVLAPLVAFDMRGNRLGMGGGFYDRTMAYLSRRQHWRKPHLVGVAYSFQEYPALPNQPWDVPLDGVVTEHGFSGFGSGK